MGGTSLCVSGYTMLLSFSGTYGQGNESDEAISLGQV